MKTLMIKILVIIMCVLHLFLLLSCNQLPFEKKETGKPALSAPELPTSEDSLKKQAFKLIRENEGLLLGLRTITGYRTLFIVADTARNQLKVEGDFPFILAPQADSFLCIKWSAHDTFFIDPLSGWPPDTVTQYWEEIKFTNLKEAHSSNNNTFRFTQDTSQQVRYMKNNVTYYDSSKIAINYLISFNASIFFSRKNNKGGEYPIFSNSEITIFMDPDLKKISTQRSWHKPEAGFNQEIKHHTSELTNFFEPPIAVEKRSKAAKELYAKGQKNQFINGEAPISQPWQKRVDTGSITYILERINGIVHVFARARAYTDSYKASPTYTLIAEYDLGPLYQPFIKHNNLAVPYKKLAPEGISIKPADVLTSPKNKLLLLLWQRELEARDLISNQKLFSYYLPPGCKIIMAEWASGIHLEKWKNKIEKESPF